MLDVSLHAARSDQLKHGTGIREAADQERVFSSLHKSSTVTVSCFELPAQNRRCKQTWSVHGMLCYCTIHLETCTRFQALACQKDPATQFVCCLRSRRPLHMLRLHGRKHCVGSFQKVAPCKTTILTPKSLNPAIFCSETACAQ